MYFHERDYSLIMKNIIKNGLIKFGDKNEFKLKSGEMSDVYVDMRAISSFPNLINLVSHKIARRVKSQDIDVICGVPYGAIPVASFISIILHKPLIIIRKETKAHGLGNMVEGTYKPGSRCLLIEDVITSGGSLLTTIETLEQHDLVVADIKVILQRKTTGIDMLRGRGYEISSYMDLDDIRTFKDITYGNDEDNKHLFPRVNDCRKMIKKKGRICFAADIPSWKKLFNILEKIHPYISMVKMHIDIMDEFNIEYVEKLKEMSLRYNFLIWEDRKFNDIGNTFKHQLYGGIYKINTWADFISVNPVAGHNMLDIIRDEKERGFVTPGIFLLAEMSSNRNLMNGIYTENVIEIARNNQDLVSGIINQSIPLERISPFLSITPGISKNVTCDSYDQQYKTIGDSNISNNDLFVIGRGIYEADDPVKECIYFCK